MKKIILFCCLILSCSGLSAQNFVHLFTYKAENGNLPAVTEEGRTVFIGDSITEVWARDFSGGFFDNDTHVGRGISGEVTAQMLLRMRADVIETGATCMVLCGGTNDIALNQGDYNEDFTYGNIVSMVQLAKENSIIPVLATVPPATGFRWRPEVTDAAEKIIALNARIRAFANEQGIALLDYFDALVSEDGRSMKPEFTYDGVHPSRQGCETMEYVFREWEKKR